jgi:hypothetical protein
MATFLQLLGRQQAEQRLGQKMTEGTLIEGVKESEDIYKESLRTFEEAAQQAGLDIGEYESKGKEIDTLTTIGSAAFPAAAPFIQLAGGLLKRGRTKPEFRLDLEQAVPGFEGMLYGKQKREDLLSSIEGTRANVSRALEGSLLSDVLGLALSSYGSYQLGKGFGTVGKDDEFIDFIRGRAKGVSTDV